MNNVTKNSSLLEEICSYVDRRRQRLLNIIQDLVRIPSENTPPSGAEFDCQQYVSTFLTQYSGFSRICICWTMFPDCASILCISAVGIIRTGRISECVRLGVGGARSLLLSGHIDTVPRGAQPWIHDPFGAQVEGNRLYGRGVNDMKAGVETSSFVLEALDEMGLTLAGDLIVESVVDEEFGGSNGTLAGRLRGYTADAAIISEPSSLRICPAQRGGRTAHILLRARGGVLNQDKLGVGVVEQLGFFLSEAGELRSAAASKRPRPSSLQP